MQSKSHMAILKIAKTEAEARGYKGKVKSYKLDMRPEDGGKPEVLVVMDDGKSLSLPMKLFSDDEDFRDAALETKRLA